RRYHLNLTIARRAGEIRGLLLRTRQPGQALADLIIAATAEYYQANIVTRNIRHFEALPLQGIQIISVNEQSAGAFLAF
ncbi:MAG: hypothetical protein ACKOC5_15980, partial [Chloroflexota bacterium]